MKPEMETRVEGLLFELAELINDATKKDVKEIKKRVRVELIRLTEMK